MSVNQLYKVDIQIWFVLLLITLPLLIAMSSEKMLIKMNEVTGLYAQLGK